MNVKNLVLFALLFAASAILFNFLVTVQVNAETYPTPIISGFSRAAGSQVKWYEVVPVRQTYHARNFSQDPDAVKDGWWSDRNFADSLPFVSSTNKWYPDYTYFNNTRDYGFTQAEWYVTKWQGVGSIKVLADASNKPVQKRIYTEVKIPKDGIYTFESWARYSKYNGPKNNVKLAMELARNGESLVSSELECPKVEQTSKVKCQDEWLPLVVRVYLLQNDKVKLTLSANQINDTKEGLADFYFTLPEKGTGVYSEYTDAY